MTKRHSPPKSYHTQLPNLLMDFVIPQLGEGEVKCLLYIVRRTVGFGDKNLDQISLSQFENGIRTGSYVLDVGTGMSRPSIIKALESLHEKGLVYSTWHCQSCFWKGDKTETKRCPRCKRTLDRSFGMASLSSKRLVSFLNKYDRLGRTWSFDAEILRFSAVTQDVATVQEDKLATLNDYISELWYPELLTKVIDQASKSIPNRKLEPDQLIKHYYKPVLELQHLASRHPASLKYALEQTLAHNVPGQVREVRGKQGRVSRLLNVKWHSYTKAIIQRELSKPIFTQSKNHQSPGLEDWANDMLKRARDLNRAKETSAARAILSELLGKTDGLAALFGNDEHKADKMVRYAFKIGEDDLLSAKDADPLYDFYPEWQLEE